MGHSVVRTESGPNHFHSSEISPKRGTTFSRQRQFTSNKINELIHVRQRIVLKMGLGPSADSHLCCRRVHELQQAMQLAESYCNPSIDILAVVISVGQRISVRPFATATFCVPLTE